MASWMASYVERLEREVKWMDEYSEYLASKRLWAEKRLKTEKPEIGKELSLKLQVANTKKVKKDTDRELAAKRLELHLLLCNSMPETCYLCAHGLCV